MAKDVINRQAKMAARLDDDLGYIWF